MQEYEQTHNIDSILFDNKNANNENGTRPTGFIGFPQQPMAPIQAPPINYPVSVTHTVRNKMLSYLFYVF